MTAAFYKEKLFKMAVAFKEVALETKERWIKEYVLPGKEMDIVSEVGSLYVKVITRCAFG